MSDSECPSCCDQVLWEAHKKFMNKMYNDRDKLDHDRVVDLVGKVSNDSDHAAPDFALRVSLQCKFRHDAL